jgi:hypothetical protein
MTGKQADDGCGYQGQLDNAALHHSSPFLGGGESGIQWVG